MNAALDPTAASSPGSTASPSLGLGAPVLGFDVGGTDIKAALIDASGDIREVLRLPSPVPGPDSGAAVVHLIGEAGEAIASRHPDAVPLAAGVSVPGYVDEAAGMAIYSENLGWRDFPMRDRVRERLGLPVAFNHDVRAAGEAEHRLGAATAFENVVVMTIGTGIAGAVFIKNTLYAGGGMAGEIGHSRVASGPACVCGGRGCLEAVASARAIAARYTELTGEPVNGAREVLQRMKAGDRTAGEVWDHALDVLALSLSQTVALIAPEAIVIGGGLAQAGADLFGPLTERLEDILTFQRRPLLLPARIGENAGVIGTALGARDLLAAATQGDA